ncbi:MAG: hypothetical protein JWN66_2368 [Sphingomonas bacterium]|uniref:hypothetical protein n=1 Tax=Sphingomonas bacterium TaxID=1895847 RepID=UPI002635C3F9|nr:hypothetical protein [Sphingomonas bacterium]MDB5705252.1 hypothetical protein [Sphingomonas bacterium]
MTRRLAAAMLIAAIAATPAWPETAPGPTPTPTPAPSPCANRAFPMLGFWAGGWNAQGDAAPVIAARSHAGKRNGGCTILQNWIRSNDTRGSSQSI